MLTTDLLLAAAVLASSPLRAQVPVGLDSAEVRRWRQDLAFLRTEMPARHANLFHTMSRPAFDSALGSIDRALPTLARHQVIVALQRLAAMIGDGHSNVGPWRDSVIGFRTLPIVLYWFEEGLVVRAADSAHAGLIGTRVVAIGTQSVDSAIARVTPLISRDNEMAIRAFAPFFLTMPEILHATGITADPSSTRLVLQQGGQRRTVHLPAAGRFRMLGGDIDRSWIAPPGWVDGRDAAPTPLWLSQPANPYWFRYLSQSRTLYCQINTIQHEPNDSLPAFMARAIATADSAGAARFVLDLRLNGGGNGVLNRSILLPLIKSRYDTAGRLFVLTGRRTWSAAQMLVTEMEKYSNAVFAGEPTASHGNHYGDSYRIVLPNSRITVRVSTLWHQYLDPRDRRMMTPPAIAAPLTFADYVLGRDPVLEAVLRAPLPPSNHEP